MTWLNPALFAVARGRRAVASCGFFRHLLSGVALEMQDPVRCGGTGPGLSGWAASIAEDLAGYPVTSLLQDLEAAQVEGGPMAGRQAELTCRVLQAWSLTLQHDLQHLPPTTSDALKSIASRMTATKSALDQVHASVIELGDPNAKGFTGRGAVAKQA